MTSTEKSETEPLLDIRGLKVAFGSKRTSVPAVHGVDLTVYPGQTVAIVGESGSGKSTTAMSVIGLLPGSGHVTGGEIRFDGADIANAPESRMETLRGTGIGLVPQDPMANLNPVWKIGFQIAETLAANGIAKGKEAKQRSVELLREAGIPDPERCADRYPHELSGGLRQRALIAMGLSCRPKLLIADEPTSALDVTVQRRILDHLDKLTDELDIAVLLITHDLGLAAERASHLVVMYKGNIVESGPALEILREPEHLYTKRLVNSAPSLASQRLGAVDTRAQVREQAVEAADAETLASVPDDVVVASDLVKRFKIGGGAPWKSNFFTAVDGVSFRLRRGTTTAIVGESASGKSTVAQMVLGLLEPTEGKVEFDGRDVRTFTGKDNLGFRRRVQPIFQNPYGSLDPMYSIFSTIEEPLSTHNIGTKAERERTVRELLDKVSLPSSVLRRYPNELSGGQRQRVAIARALALKPEVVVCDEAVSALDVLVQAQILSLLNDLQAELGLSYLFITHDLAVVRQIADDVLVMSKGKVVESATTTEVFDNPTQAYTQELLAAIPGRDLL